MAIKFGSKQLNNPTPHNVSMLFDFLAIICGIVGGFLTTASFIPHSVSDPLSTTITALLIPILLAAKRFFGVEVDTRKVLTENVTEIETNPKDN